MNATGHVGEITPKSVVEDAEYQYTMYTHEGMVLNIISYLCGLKRFEI